MNFPLLLAVLSVHVPAGDAASMICDVAIVGAGPGGAYLAARLAEAEDAGRVCIFDMGMRVGGRIHSLRSQGPRGDLVVEAGGYRFALNSTVTPSGPGGKPFRVYTPLTRHLIIDRLKLRWKRYDPSTTQWDHELAKIVDGQGHDLGFLTFVEDLIKVAEATGRVRLHLEHELTSLSRAPDGSLYTLAFANGASVTAERVVLNLPQLPLLRVLANSPSLGTSHASPAAVDVLNAVSAYPIAKVYVYYEDAWWRNILRLNQGPFNNTDRWKPTSGAEAMDPCFASRQTPAPLQGAYHDGDVRCDGPAGAPCRGFLQAAYIHETPSIAYYAQWRTAKHGDSVMHVDGTEPRGARLLESVHEALVDLHEPLLKRVPGALDRVRPLRPASGIVSVWDGRADGLETGCHMPRDLGVPRGPGGLPSGIPRGRIPVDAMAPFPGAPNVFVANEAWGMLNCFAEGSLQMAENIAHVQFGLARPSWIPERVYDADILFASDDQALQRRAEESPRMGDVDVMRALQGLSSPLHP